MSIAKLEFKLPEEEYEFKLAQRGRDYYCVILEVQRLLRDFRKYDDSDPKKYPEYFESIQRAVNEAQTEDIE
jgi:hypothetical protein